jgi:hypothetical protein
MTGIETLIALMKIIVPMGAIIFSAILKFLWDIKSNSKEVQKEFQTFKLDFTFLIVKLKTVILSLKQIIYFLNLRMSS